MENNNSKKNILLSVLGIAMLLVATVGVTFAFFSYTRVGNTVSTLSTGTISFNFTTSKTLELTNQSPISDATAKALTGDKDKVEFTITSTITNTDKKLEYNVYAVPEELTTGDFTGKVQFQRDEIKLYIVGQVVDSKTAITFTANQNYGTADTMAAGYDSTENRTLLGTGYVTGVGAMSFKVYMWISDTVTYGDGTGVKYSLADYGNLYYAMRIRVESYDVAA